MASTSLGPGRFGDHGEGAVEPVPQGGVGPVPDDDAHALDVVAVMRLGAERLARHEGGGLGPNLFGTKLGIFVALLFVTLPFTVRTVQPVLLDLD